MIKFQTIFTKYFLLINLDSSQEINACLLDLSECFKPCINLGIASNHKLILLFSKLLDHGLLAFPILLLHLAFERVSRSAIITIVEAIGAWICQAFVIWVV